MMYMLDTNAFSALMKNHPKLIQRFVAEPTKNICISSIVWAEIRYGIRKKGSQKWQQISDKLIQGVRIVPFDKKTADTYATLRSEMERQGKNLSPLDMLIASCALANQCVLVTNDQAFNHISLLQVEDWTA